MFELKQAGAHTYFINSPSKIGIYEMGDGEVCLIDSGFEVDGEKIMRILDDNNWHLNRIINTHSHADHIGANHFLQTKTGCKVYFSLGELGFVGSPIEEGTVMYGAYPSRALKAKCTCAKGSIASVLTEEALPSGFEMINLPGHSFEMTGLKTPDDVWFLADSMISETFINNNYIAFLYDVKAYLESLSQIERLQGQMFVPSHTSAKTEVKSLAKINADCVNNVVETILEACDTPKSFDDIMKHLMDKLGYSMDFNLYLVISSIVRSYISYLQDADALVGEFFDNKLFWHRIK